MKLAGQFALREDQSMFVLYRKKRSLKMVLISFRTCYNSILVKICVNKLSLNINIGRASKLKQKRAILLHEIPGIPNVFKKKHFLGT